MLPLVILAAIWVLALAAVIALCRAARRGDELLAAEREAARRRELAAGIVVIDGPGLLSAQDLRASDSARAPQPLATSGAV